MTQNYTTVVGESAAKAALEAYGLDKVRDGMRRATDIARECWNDPQCEAEINEPVIWIMRTVDGFYPVVPSNKCRPEDHGRLNDHVIRIEDTHGNVLWERAIQ